jgi:NADPH:quinone reductase
VPDGVDLDVAVALLADGRTATMLVRAADIGAGDRVLVEAAAGGVGTLLVQLAKAAGARVVAAAGGPDKVEVALDLGADVGVDYREPNWPSDVRDAVGGVDVVFDGVGGEIARSAFELLDSGGRMLTFGLASGTWADISAEEAGRRGVTVRRGPFAAAEEFGDLTRSAFTEAAAGRLRVLIGQRFPLERADAAHAAIESRATLGRTLLHTR